MCVTDPHPFGVSSWAGKLATLQMFTLIRTPLEKFKAPALAVGHIPTELLCPSPEQRQQ